MNEEQHETGDDSEVRRCFNCGADSSDRVIIPSEHQGKDGWVCVRCLPSFIHGGG